MNNCYDYYDAYESGQVLNNNNNNNNNKIKTFSCGICKQSKFVLKKRVCDSESVFKCDDCINHSEKNHVEQNVVEQQDQTQTQEPRWRWFSFF